MLEMIGAIQKAGGTVRIISLRPKPMDALKAWLADAETGWSEQLAAFKAHVERG